MESREWRGQSGQCFSKESVISGQEHYIFRIILVCLASNLNCVREG